MKHNFISFTLESNSWSCHSGCKKFCLPSCKKSCCSAGSQTYQEGMFKDLLNYQDSLSPSLIPPAQSVLFMSPAPPAQPAPSMPLATPAPPAPSQASLGQLFTSAYQQTTEGSPTAVQCGQWCPKSCAPTCQSRKLYVSLQTKINVFNHIHLLFLRPCFLGPRSQNKIFFFNCFN